MFGEGQERWSDEMIMMIWCVEVYDGSTEARNNKTEWSARKMTRNNNWQTTNLQMFPEHDKNELRVL